MTHNLSIGQYFPSDSFVHKLDARFKLMATVLLIIVIFFIKTWLGYLSLAVFIAATVVFSKTSVMLVLKNIKAMWVVLIFAFVLNVFFTAGEELLLQWQFITIYKEGVLKALELAVRLVFLVVLSSILTYTTSAKEITDAIESLFKPLKVIKFPVHEMALMMSIALRFIPTLMEETDRITKAQMARGATFDSGNLISRIKDMLPILIPLFISAFKRAEDLALAMEARCYHGGDDRTKLKQLKYTWRDLVGTVAVLAESVFIFLGI